MRIAWLVKDWNTLIEQRQQVVGNDRRIKGRELLVDRINDRTTVLGPGNRTVVWFHGCARGCPGCVAAGMNAGADYVRYTPDELSRRVLAVDGVEGVTLSGGEPFDQDVEPMTIFLMAVRT